MDAKVIDKFFKAEAEAQQAANSRVQPDQILQPGDFAVGKAHGINIYSEILDPVAGLLAGRNEAELEEEDRDEIADTRDTYAQPHMRFFRFTKSYSVACPKGELGDRHLSTIERKLTEAEFLRFKEMGWP